MQCPRCNTTLPDSATICSRCGSPVSTASGARFSYLPAGAPPWPTMVPQQFSFTPAPVPQAAFSTAPVVEKAPEKKRTLGIPAILSLLILSILIGGGLAFGLVTLNRQPATAGTQRPVALPTAGTGATPATTPTTGTSQLPDVPSFATFSNTTMGVSIQYPSDWQQPTPQTTQSNDIVVSLLPQQQLGIQVQLIRFSPSTTAQEQNAAAVNQFILNGFKQNQGVNNFQATTASKRTLGGTQWDEQDATFANSQGDNFDFVTLTVQHNKNYFTIFFYCPDVYYQEAIQKYFQPMLNSFKFLS